jgi:hypothetical protein
MSAFPMTFHGLALMPHLFAPRRAAPSHLSGLIQTKGGRRFGLWFLAGHSKRVLVRVSVSSVCGVSGCCPFMTK